MVRRSLRHPCPVDFHGGFVRDGRAHPRWIDRNRWWQIRQGSRRGHAAPSRSGRWSVRQGGMQLPVVGERFSSRIEPCSTTSVRDQRAIGSWPQLRRDHARAHRPQPAEGDRPVVPTGPVGQHPGPRLRQDQLRIRTRWRDEGWRWSAARGAHDQRPVGAERSITTSTSTSKGSRGVVQALGGVDMCIPAENVNTPGWVTQEQADGSSTSVYVSEVGHIVDPGTGLDVRPGCQRLSPLQALAYVRSRHLAMRHLLRPQPDRPPAAVPARRIEPPAAVRDVHALTLVGPIAFRHAT